jgi:hypothetical protein
VIPRGSLEEFRAIAIVVSTVVVGLLTTIAVLLGFWVFLFFALTDPAFGADLMRPSTGTVADHTLGWDPGVEDAAHPRADFFEFQQSLAGWHPPTWSAAFSMTYANASFTVTRKDGTTAVECCETPTVVLRRYWYRVRGCHGTITNPIDCSAWTVEGNRLEVSSTTNGVETARNLRSNE